MPYVEPGRYASPRAVLARVQRGPPQPLHELAPTAPAELVAICERAMARAPHDRYRDMSALADDLRAYIEHRVVSAYETGAVAELRKWVVRNKPLAASLAAVLLLALATGGVFAWLSSELSVKNDDLQHALTDAETQRQLAVDNALAAEANAEQARRERANVLRLSTLQELEDLRREADESWPATPDRLAAYDAWLARAHALVAGLERGADGSDLGHRRQLVLLRQRALPQPDAATQGSAPRSWRFASADDTWWHGQLTKLIDELDAFADPATGLIAGTSASWGWGVGRRRAFAAAVSGVSLTSDEAQRRWAEATTSIADRERCPAYAGMRLPPQLGLLPIGRDPQSGLWEFWHVPSGDEPRRGEDGCLVLTETSGLVLVLIPGGRFWMGAQGLEPGGRNHDPHATEIESPVHEVELVPYFLSKYEMSQGQWQHFTDRNPSQYGPGSVFGDRVTTLLHPVEQVSWEDAMSTLPRLGLQLPSEAQWERGARSGSNTPWWTGADRDTLMEPIAANLADQAAARGGAIWTDIRDWPELDDGWVVHAPVDSFAPNRFGLHNVHGNVWEWCLDSFDAYAGGLQRDPVNDDPLARDRVNRGGSFLSAAANARATVRLFNSPVSRVNNLGLRPARVVTP
jgi:formylglycine-generating enzyme required for sulfatase activity